MSKWEECNNESVDLIIRWLNLSPDTEMFYAEDRFYIKIRMPDERIGIPLDSSTENLTTSGDSNAK